MTYAIIDIFFCLIVFIFMIHGSIRGFVDEFFSKLAFIIALIASFLFYSSFITLYEKYVSVLIIRNTLSFLSVFIIVYIIVRLIQKIVGLAFRGEILKGLDKSLGILLGAVEGFLLVGIILFILYSQQFFNAEALLKDSFFVKILSPFIGEAQTYFFKVIETKNV
ncbi:MAG: CvpA family protein [Treponemataceae bacterium]